MYIQIDSLNQSLIGLWYDRIAGEFETPSFSILADHSTDFINYRNTNLCLSDVLDAKAESDHTHTGYASTSHTHSNYAESDHTHEQSEITGLETALAGKASSSHTHSGYAATTHTHSNYAATSHTHAQSDVTGLETALSGKAAASHTHDYAATNHTHSNYASTTHNHDDDYAEVDHTHTGYAATNHTHSGYASSSHTHSNYASTSHTHSNYAVANNVYTKDEADSAFLPLAGGELNGALNVKGIIRCNGNQSVYYSGTNCTFGTNNATSVTFACVYSGSMAVNAGTFSTYTILPRSYGSSISATIGNSSSRFKYIYLQNSPSVSSDLRTKRDVRNLDVKELSEFIGKLNIVGYNYKEDSADDKEKIGVIAQQLIESNDKVAPYFVDEDEEGMLSLRLSDLVFPLIAAVQDLQKRVAELENK